MMNFESIHDEQVEYDSASNSFHIFHDWTGAESVSTTLAVAFGTITGTAPDQLKPLYAVIDPDALDEFFQFDADGVPRTDGCVRFSYADYEVTVRSSGKIVIVE